MATKVKKFVIFVVWANNTTKVCKYEFTSKKQLKDFMDGAYEAVHKIYGTTDDPTSGWDHIFTFDTQSAADRFVIEGIYE